MRIREERCRYQAEALLNSALDIRRVYLGDRHRDTLDVRTSPAVMLHARGDAAASAAALSLVLQIQREAFGPLEECTQTTVRLLRDLQTAF